MKRLVLVSVMGLGLYACGGDKPADQPKLRCRGQHRGLVL